MILETIISGASSIITELHRLRRQLIAAQRSARPMSPVPTVPTNPLPCAPVHKIEESKLALPRRETRDPRRETGVPSAPLVRVLGRDRGAPRDIRVLSSIPAKTGKNRQLRAWPH